MRDINDAVPSSSAFPGMTNQERTWQAVGPKEDDGLITEQFSAAPHSSDCSTHLEGKDALRPNPDLTLIAALLDRSGSMEDCKKATESGFDELIAKHRRGTTAPESCG